MKFMRTIDRNKVKRAFGNQAGEYDNHATVQKRVVAKLLSILSREDIEPRSLLDVGSGTGMLLRSLMDMYGDLLAVGVDQALGMNLKARQRLLHDTRVHLVTADAEHLPFAGSSFDLVLSTSTFQWLDELDTAFGEVFRLLTPGGLFCFALFGEKTLHELRDSYSSALEASVSRENRFHIFRTPTDVDSAFERAGFLGRRITTEMEVEFHRDVPALLRSLKRIGAGNASPLAPRGLAGRRIMLDMIQRYEDGYRSGSGIPASYEIIYGLGRKPLHPR